MTKLLWQCSKHYIPYSNNLIRKDLYVVQVDPHFVHLKTAAIMAMKLYIRVYLEMHVLSQIGLNKHSEMLRLTQPGLRHIVLELRLLQQELQKYISTQF